MTGHLKQICRTCGIVVLQCKCFNCDQRIEHVTCDDCARKSLAPPFEEQTVREWLGKKGYGRKPGLFDECAACKRSLAEHRLLGSLCPTPQGLSTIRFTRQVFTPKVTP